MMPKHGPIPSLIGSTHGTVSFHVAGKKSKCRRCKGVIRKDTMCVRVTKPGRMGAGAPYCSDCFAEVLDQTQRKLAALRVELQSAHEINWEAEGKNRDSILC